MDDKKFEKIIKSRLNNYSDPVYDAAASASFNEKLSTLDKGTWYQRYRTETLVAASLVLVLLFNYFFLKETKGTWTEQSQMAVREYQAEISKLQTEIGQLRLLTPDTIYMPSASQNTARQLPQIQQVKVSYPQPADSQQLVAWLLRRLASHTTPAIGDYYIFHRDSLPTMAQVKSLKKRHVSLDGGFIAFQSDSEEDDFIIDTVAVASTLRNQKPQVKLPHAVINDIEKHYMSGVGIRVGGGFDLVHSAPDLGLITNTVRGGAFGEFVVSPSLSLVTGLQYSRRNHRISSNEIDVNSYPGIDQNLGQFKELQIKSAILEVPVNVKYYYNLNQAQRFYLAVGLSPNIFLSQTFKYGYSLGSTPQSGDEDVILTSESPVENSKLYWGTINSELGFSYDLPRNRIVQVAAFYQKGIAGVGQENVVQNLLGLKSTLWFKVR